MPSLTVEIPQNINLFYPDPLSAVIGYLLSGIILYGFVEYFWKRKNLWSSDSDHGIIFTTAAYTALLLFWPIFAADVFTSAMKVLDKKGLKKDFRREL